MNDLFSKQTVKVSQKLEEVYQELALCEESKIIKEQEMKENQSSITVLKEELVELNYRIGLLTYPKTFRKELWMREGISPLILSFLLLLTIAIKPFFPGSASVVDFLSGLLVFGVIANGAYHGKNIFFGLKEIRGVEKHYRLKDSEERKRRVQTLIRYRENEQVEKKHSIYILEQKMSKLEELVCDLEQIIDILKQEQGKAIDEYFNQVLAFQEHLDESFVQNKNISLMMRKLEIKLDESFQSN